MSINTDLPQGQTFKDFQTSASDKEKRSDAYGLIVARHVANIAFGADSYIVNRNARYAINRAWATGRTNIQAMFADRMGLNGTVNYVNINWKALSMVNTIVSRLVGRWMQRNEKVNVTATDTLSLTQKNDEYEQIEFEFMHRQKLRELEQISGVPMTPQNQFRPDSLEELELWRQEIQRLPEEILYQMNCNDALDANGWSDVLKEKMLHDSAEVGFVGTYTWMDEQGVIHVDIVKPENAIYTYSEFPDFRDTTIRGQVKSMKITELRRKYGAQFGGKLTEQEIYELAATTKDWQNSDKLAWQDIWLGMYPRPYDDWNFDYIHFELKTLDKEGYTITKTKTNNRTLITKGYPESKKLKDNQEYVEDKNWIIYEGVYAREAQKLLQWDLKKNMVRPHDPKESGNVEFSYSFYMYQNKDMKNLAVPEKIEAPVEQLILILLRMQQCVMRMRPMGAQINIDALQELELGLGDKKTSPEEAKRIYDQTGDIYFRGRDADGKPLPVPITELQNTGFMGQMQGLIEMYRFQYSVLKDELGEDPNLISQALTPRVSQGNVQASQQAGEFATDYMYTSYIRCMQETAKKMACLMYDSVRYGSKAYRTIMGQETIKGRVFGTKIKLLPTVFEIQNLKDMLNQAIASTPDLVIYLDTFKVLRMAQEDIKLAELYYRQAMKKMLQSKAEQASKNAQENAQIQIQSAQAQNEGKAKLEELKGQVKAQQTDADAIASNRNTVLAGIFEIYKLQMQNGQPFPAELRNLAHVTLETVALPAMIQNKEMREVAIQKMHDDVAADQEQQQAAAQEQSQQEPEMPNQMPAQQSMPPQQMMVA